MAWDGSGTFTRTNGDGQTGANTWADADAAGHNIDADEHDDHDQDLADGIQACVTKNGESKPTADFKPNADDAYDLGSAALRWQTLFLSGRLNEAKGADVVSAATIDLDAATGNLVDVTGVVTVTAITLSVGREAVVRFTGALTLTHGASLVLPGAVNIATAAGDFATFRGYAAGVVRCVSYQRASIPVAGYTSAAQTITAAGSLTLAHGLGAVPTQFQMRLKCTSAELNYSVNDEVVIGELADFSKNYGVSIVPDATNLNIRFAIGTASDANFAMPNKTTGAVNSIVNAKWQAIFRAWVR